MALYSDICNRIGSLLRHLYSDWLFTQTSVRSWKKSNSYRIAYLFLIIIRLPVIYHKINTIRHTFLKITYCFCSKIVFFQSPPPKKPNQVVSCDSKSYSLTNLIHDRGTVIYKKKYKKKSPHQNRQWTMLYLTVIYLLLKT